MQTPNRRDPFQISRSVKFLNKDPQAQHGASLEAELTRVLKSVQDPSGALTHPGLLPPEHLKDRVDAPEVTAVKVGQHVEVTARYRVRR